MNVISLGWGIQSFTLASMAALGELPPVDAAIHADTTHERSETYSFAARWTAWLISKSVRIVTVLNPQVQIITTQKSCKTNLPVFVKTQNKTGGRLRRQCTREWKVRPIRRWLQENRNGESVIMQIGITTDEFSRVKPSDVKYITHSWPLLDLRMSRDDCIQWLKAHDLEVPSKSSCVFCPYHDKSTWREIKLSNKQDWNKATAIDRSLRKVSPPYDLFIHRKLIPLETIDFQNSEDRGQLNMWEEECTGLCGV